MTSIKTLKAELENCTSARKKVELQQAISFLQKQQAQRIAAYKNSIPFLAKKAGMTIDEYCSFHGIEP